MEIHQSSQSVDLSGYVPYTGATTTLNMGVRSIYAGNVEKALSATLTRNGSGYVTTKAYTGGVTLTYTRDANNFITSKTDGTKTWSYTRNGSNQITAITVT